MLADNDPMPFGQHGPKGDKRTMEKVPATYLIWLRDTWAKENKQPSNMTPDQRDVYDYIKESEAALLSECPDHTDTD